MSKICRTVFLEEFLTSELLRDRQSGVCLNRHQQMYTKEIMESSRREFLGLAAFLGIQGSSLSFLRGSGKLRDPAVRDPYLHSMYAPVATEVTDPLTDLTVI